MKWLVVHPGPNFSVADVFTGWCEALVEHGQQVSRFALDDRLTFYGRVLMETEEPGKFRRALTDGQAVERSIDGIYSHLYRWRPDVLLWVSGFFCPPDLLDLARRSGTRVVVLHTESPYEDDRQIALAAHADLNLVNDPTNVERFRTVAPAHYMPHAYRPSLHHPGAPPAECVCDFAFVGTGYPSRVEFFEALDLDGLDVVLAGNWQMLGEGSRLRKLVGHDIDVCFDNADAVDLYRGARVGINLYRRESQRPELAAGWSMGPREVEMAACGAFFLREPRGEGDELLPMLPRFGSPEEASELLRWWLAHEDARAESARNARAAVADRTFRNHAARLLGWLDKKG